MFPCLRPIIGQVLKRALDSDGERVQYKEAEMSTDLIRATSSVPNVRAEEQPSDPALGFERNYRAFSTAVIHSMKELSEIADKRLSTFLLVLGTTILLLSMFWKLRPLGIEVSGLNAVEFIALLVVAAGIVGVGTHLRWRQIQMDHENFNRFRELNFKSLEQANQASVRAAEAAQAAWLRAADKAHETVVAPDRIFPGPPEPV
jgi:hypothetical protein